MVKFVFLSNVSHFDTPHIEIILNECNISFYFKDLHDSSILAGWVPPGSKFIEKALFVENNKIEIIQEKLKKYINK
ncbi:hypothetical protein OAJ42_01390 [Flavobacteriales bacterium]|nr:hypothetical protein [Flavobacteriales bacterium]